MTLYLDNTTIKQADVILLGFPLMWPMPSEVRRNDLLNYERLTRDDGPAMTWSMHAIGFIELGDFDKAEQLFRRSYETYVRPPFNVSRKQCFIGILYVYLCSLNLSLLLYRYGQKHEQA